MDTIKSSEFRRRYAGLTEPTIVTVGLGAVLGRWYPGGDSHDVVAAAESAALAEEVARLKRLLAQRVTHETVNGAGVTITNAIAGQQPERGVRSFAEFRPAPKPGKGR